MNALGNVLYARARLISIATSLANVQEILAQADAELAACRKENAHSQLCDNNYLQVYARAAQRTYLAGSDPQPQLERALETLTTLHKQGGNFLDVEQHAALVQLVGASNQVRKHQDPEAALKELHAALTRCFAIGAQDAMCRTLAAQGELLAAEREAQLDKPTVPILKRALKRAIEATKIPETYPDAWQVLAETYLRLAQAAGIQPQARDQYVTAGVTAVQKVFAINPRHALGLATLGELEVLRAHSQADPEARHKSAQAAVTALAQALASDPFLSPSRSALLAQAKAMTTAP